jgi:hypothetical protein
VGRPPPPCQRTCHSSWRSQPARYRTSPRIDRSPTARGGSGGGPSRRRGCIQTGDGRGSGAAGVTGVVVADWSSATPARLAPFRRRRDGRTPTISKVRVFRAAAVQSLALVFVLAAFAGCGAEDGSAAPTGPAAFPDESWAELASDGGDALWLAVAGYRRDGNFGLRVFRRAGPGWEQLPVPSGRISDDLPLSITVPTGSRMPCLGYSAGSQPAPVITCFDGEDWEPRELPAPPRGQLVQVATYRGDLVALVDQQETQRSRYLLLRDGEGGWASAPPISAPPAIAQIALEDDPRKAAASFPRVGFATQGLYSQHFIAELRNGRWRRLKPSLRKVGTGPLVGGPALLGNRILYPVTEADMEPWSFSVLTARIGSPRATRQRLSSGGGNAQGHLDLVGVRVWATWQEHEPSKSRGFQTAIFAAELSPTGRVRRKLRLWHGVSIGPGSLQIIEFEGRTLALYMRRSANGRGLQAFIRRIVDRSSRSPDRSGLLEHRRCTISRSSPLTWGRS